jgi:hypothetical protein
MHPWVERVTERGFLDWILHFDEYIGDFVKYLVSKKIRRAVDNRLVTQLQPLLDSKLPIVMISHSWGTVVAHNVLRNLADGKVNLHCTLGSPLWMGPIRRILQFDEKRNNCDRWINIDAHGDLIGGQLHGVYTVNQDYSVPCVGGHPHGSYFHPDNTLVQKEIVTRAVTEIPRLPVVTPELAASMVAGTELPTTRRTKKPAQTRRPEPPA